MVPPLNCIIFSQNNFKYQHIIDSDFANQNSMLNKFLKCDSLKTFKKPPTSGSNFNVREIKKSIKLQKLASEKFRQFSKNMHDIKETYHFWSDICHINHKLDIDYSFFYDLAQKTEGLIHYLKNYYNRPRPYQICTKLNLPLDKLTEKKCSSASYPSGHACQSFLFASVLSQKFRDKRQFFAEVADNIALSRVVAGVHFPSDVFAGKKLASIIYKQNF